MSFRSSVPNSSVCDPRVPTHSFLRKRSETLSTAFFSPPLQWLFCSMCQVSLGIYCPSSRSGEVGVRPEAETDGARRDDDLDFLRLMRGVPWVSVWVVWCLRGCDGVAKEPGDESVSNAKRVNFWKGLDGSVVGERDGVANRLCSKIRRLLGRNKLYRPCPSNRRQCS